MSAERSKLSPERLKLLTKLLGAKPSGASSQTIPRQTTAGPFPLSFSQQRLWFLDQLIPENPQYNMPASIRLKVPINVSVLERSLNEIVKRHSILRTTFATVDDKPVQQVADSFSLNLSVKDLRTLPPDEREEEALRLATEEALCPFNLSTGPLLRAGLLQLDTHEHVFLLIMHHIISDGWSMNIFWQELTAVYTAYQAGRPSPLPALPIQYADYATWQRQWLQGDVLELQLNHWKHKLTDLEELQLPTDKPRPAVQSFRGNRIPLALSRSLTDELKALSRRQGVTLFMTLLAAFKALLHRYTGQVDLVIGTPTAGRNHAELEGLIGFFVNSLVLRSDLSGDPTFHDLLQRIREVTTGAYAHQDLPFERLVEELKPERDLNRNPLFQVTFQFMNTLGSAQPSDPGEDDLSVNRATAIFDLSCDLWETSDGLRGRFEYDTDLFDGETINRMTDHFRVLLEGIVADSDQRLSQLPFLTEPERSQLVLEWNTTSVDFPPNSCLFELFEAQADLTPQAAAVIFGEQQLSYEQLDREANQLAHYLRKRGVGPDTLVGIYLERSLEMVVSLLGVLKAGGAYVPLDLDYPRERVALMIEDAAIKLVLTQQHLAQDLGEQKIGTVCLDADWDSIALESDKRPALDVVPDNLAYVIYTSGSTGRPKGVMISHRAICNHMLWMQMTFPLTSADRVLQRTSFSFDASVWEFYAPLLAGAKLVVAPLNAHRDSAETIRAITKHQITTLQLVPSLLRVLIEEQELEKCVSLKRVYCGGEALPRELYVRLSARLPTTLCNLYGPTEAAIDASFFSCDGSGGEFVPIGRPVANMQMYVLDRNLQLVPAGVPGELHIGGIGLARGYVNRPDLTSERFIPNPFSTAPGVRLYQTGDRVRYLPDGRLEYLGRLDKQVKLRGYRVEPAEIEAVLARHDSVREAVVLANDAGAKGKQLVAYVVAHTDSILKVDELRAYLKEKLPDYMVPASFVLLEALPLLPNGKIDFEALVAGDGLSTAGGTDYVDPCSPLEERLAAIYRDVLGTKSVGVEDNFFSDLGGHSLLATQLVSRLRKTFNLDVPLRVIFEAPTIARLAQVIETLVWTAYGAEPDPGADTEDYEEGDI